MVNLDTRIILGIIGNFTSFMMFAIKLPLIWKMWKKKSVENNISYHRHAVSALHCMMWVFYSTPFVHPHSILVTTSSSIGAFICTIYYVIYFHFADKPTRKSMVSLYIAVFVILGGLIWFTLGVFDSHATRSGYVGFFCDLIGFILYGVDFTYVVGVITKGDIQVRLPLQLFDFLICFLNGVVWCAYALIKLDIYILIESGFGAFVGFIEFFLLVGYCCVQRFRTIKLSPIDDC